MHGNTKWLVLALAVAAGLAIAGSTMAQDAGGEGPMQVFVLTGQSNMAGRAPIQPEDAEPIEGAFLWNIAEQKWEAAAPPYNRYSPHAKGASMQRLNCGPSFVRAWREAHPGVRIGIVCAVRGGTSIEQWKKGETKPWPLFDTSVKEVQAALAASPGAELKGILWHQGEANSSRAEKYPAQLAELIADFRADLGEPELPFVFSQLGRFNAGYAAFNEMIVEQPASIPHTACITTEDLEAIDQAHFDTEGQRALGERYAEAMLELVEAAGGK